MRRGDLERLRLAPGEVGVAARLDHACEVDARVGATAAVHLDECRARDIRVRDAGGEVAHVRTRRGGDYLGEAGPGVRRRLPARTEDRRPRAGRARRIDARDEDVVVRLEVGGEPGDRGERVRPGGRAAPRAHPAPRDAEDGAGDRVEDRCRAVGLQRAGDGGHGAARCHEGRRAAEAGAGVRALAHLHTGADGVDEGEQRASAGGGQPEPRRHRHGAEARPTAVAARRTRAHHALVAHRAGRGVDARSQQRAVGWSGDGTWALGFGARVPAFPAQPRDTDVAVVQLDVDVGRAAGGLLRGEESRGQTVRTSDPLPHPPPRRGRGSSQTFDSEIAASPS